MFGLDKRSLMFPKLVFLRDGALVKESQAKYASNPPISKQPKAMAKPTSTPVRLYRLDWTRMEEVKMQRQQERLAALIKDGSIPDQPFVYLKSLPESYAAAMDAMVFAIPDSYMREINHCCMAAQAEWEHPYPFDSAIRDTCFEPAAAFVKVAFHLLADCIYDEHKQYYGREWTTKQVFFQTALVRYWMHQVGTWTAMGYAGLKIDKSTGKMSNPFAPSPVGVALTPVETMRMDMLEFYERIEAAIPRPKIPWAEMPLPDKGALTCAPKRKARKK
jgi:hypothetical protein